MSRRRRNYRSAQHAAWTRFGWKCWPLFVFGPLVLFVMVLSTVLGTLHWLWISVPHPLLAAGSVVVAVLAGAVVHRLRRGGGGWRSWRRPLAVWSMTTAGVAVLVFAAWTAIGGPA